MIIYEITNDQKHYTPSTFIVTMAGVYVENKELGFFKHPSITSMAHLISHINRCKSDGCTVKKYETRFDEKEEEK